MTGLDSADAFRHSDDRLLRYATFFGLGSFLAALISYNFVDIDIWHEMALIRESVSAGHLLLADPYAYTPTLSPWVDHEWGAGAIAYFLTTCWGSHSLVILKFALALGCSIFCVRCARSMGADFRVLGTVAPVAILLSYLGFFALIRAQAYSFFFTALLLLFLEMDRKHSRRWVIAWLVIFPIWLNIHGGFVVGMGLLGLHIVEERLRRNPVRHLLLVLSIMCLEVFLNPYGLAYLKYLSRALTMPRPYVPEWRPVWDFGLYWTLPFVVAVIVILYVLGSRGLGHLPGILPLSATLVEATLHRKLLPFFAIAWLCYVPPSLQNAPATGWLVQFVNRRRRFWVTVWVLVSCVCWTAAVRSKVWEVLVPQYIYPVGPVKYLAEQKFRGNLLVPFRLGAYASWKLFPRVKVSLDGRYEEVYPESVVRNVFSFYEARPGWQSALNDYPTDLALVPKDAPVRQKMQQSAWLRVFVDQQFELYARPGLALTGVDWTSSSFAGAFP